MRCRVAPQAAIGVVGNPAICPTFRVRWGSEREYGFMPGRARRATRPTPEQVSASMWAWRRLRQPASVLGHVSPSASPCARPPRCRSAIELGNPLGSRAGTPTGGEGQGRGAQGRNEEQRRRARSCDDTHQVSSGAKRERLLRARDFRRLMPQNGHRLTRHGRVGHPERRR